MGFFVKKPFALSGPGASVEGPQPQIESMPAHIATPGKPACQPAEEVPPAVPLGSVTLHRRTEGATHHRGLWRPVTRGTVGCHLSSCRSHGDTLCRWETASTGIVCVLEIQLQLPQGRQGGGRRGGSAQPGQRPCPMRSRRHQSRAIAFLRPDCRAGRRWENNTTSTGRGRTYLCRRQDKRMGQKNWLLF